MVTKQHDKTRLGRESSVDPLLMDIPGTIPTTLLHNTPGKMSTAEREEKRAPSQAWSTLNDTGIAGMGRSTT